MPAKTRRATDGQDREISNALLPIIEHERKQFEDQQERTLRFYHERGTVVNLLKQGRDPLDRNKVKSFGNNPVDVLADEIGQERSTLYRCGQFVEMIPDEKSLNDLLAKIAEHMAPTGFSHIKMVLVVPTNKLGVDPHSRRKQLLFKAIEKKWTLVQLHEEVEAIRESLRERTDERRQSRNQKFSKHLSGFLKLTKKFNDSVVTQFDTPISQMLESPPSEVTYQMTRLLEETIKNAEATIEQLTKAAAASKALLQSEKFVGNDSHEPAR